MKISHIPEPIQKTFWMLKRLKNDDYAFTWLLKKYTQIECSYGHYYLKDTKIWFNHTPYNVHDRSMNRNNIYREFNGKTTEERPEV